MDPINSAALASRISALVGQVARKGKDAARTSGARTAPNAGSSKAPSLADIVARRLRTLNAAGPISRKQLGRVVVETVLLDHFGTQFATSAGFQSVVDSTVEALEAEAHFQSAIDAAIGESKAI